MGKAETFEHHFKKACDLAQIPISDSTAIKCKAPVENQYGKKRKKVTKPDWLIYHPEDETIMCHVEVTEGNGDSAHKQSQLRVVEQARRESRSPIPYIIVTGDIILELLDFIEQFSKTQQQDIVDQLHQYIISLTGWESILQVEC